MNQPTATVEARIDTTQVRVEKVEGMISKGTGRATALGGLEVQLRQMQIQIDELRHGGQRGGDHVRDNPKVLHRVLGRLAGFSSKDIAAKWLDDKFASGSGLQTGWQLRHR